MAYFYGTLSNGDSKPVTRTGSIASGGLETEVMTRRGRIRVELWLGPETPGGPLVDRFKVTLLEHPENDRGDRRVLAMGTLGASMWSSPKGGDA